MILFALKHSFAFLYRPLSAALAVGLTLAATAAPLQAKHAPVKDPTILDFDWETLIKSKGSDPWHLGELTPPQTATVSVPENAVWLARQDAPFFLDVDGYRGVPVVSFPIMLAPGTHGLQLDLKLRIGGALVDAGGNFGASLTNPESIRTCGGQDRFCLGDQKLIGVKGSAKGTLFTLQNDPRILVRKSDAGFVIEDGNGLRQYYTAASMETLDSGPWEINAIVDWFDNYVLYKYDDQTGNIKSIYYGQDNAQKKDLRAVHFTYDSAVDRAISTIATMVADRTIRTYYLGRNPAGQLNKLTECAPGKSGIPVCYAPYEFKWKASADGKYSLFSSVTNGNGGQTDIAYQQHAGGPVVSTLTLFAGGAEMQENLFHFANPQVIDGQRIGFGLSRTQRADDKIGQFTEYGIGKYAGITVKEGTYILEDGQQIEDADLQSLTDVTYEFKDAGRGPEVPFLLSQTTTRRYLPDGRQEEALVQSRQYDARGRIKGITTEEGDEFFTYLDEVDESQIGEVAGNLVAERRYVSHKTGIVSSKTWTYELNGGVLVQSSISGTRDGVKLNKAASEQTVDAHGNIVQIKKGERTTTVTYDKAHETFPTEMKVTTKDKQDAVLLDYDPATGQILSDTLPGGSKTVIALDGMGREVSVRTTLRGPQEKPDRDSRKQIDITDRTEITAGQDGVTIKTKTVTQINKTTQETTTKVIRTHTDGLGRVVRLEGQDIGPGGKLTANSFLENTYSATGQVTTIVDEVGTRQLIVYDVNGQIIREEKGGYGVTEFTYDDLGRVSRILKAGDPIDLFYDSQNRLIKKILPGNREYHYRYDERFPSKIREVALPSDKLIRFTYTASGQVLQKTVQIPLAKGPVEFTTEFSYQRNQLKSVTYPGGGSVAYTYDSSRLSAINWANSVPENWGSLNKPIVEYAPEIKKDRSLALTKILGNGTHETLNWRPDGTLSDITASRPSGPGEGDKPFSRLAYSFGDDRGLINAEERSIWGRGGEDTLIKNYTYDEQNRLNSFTEKVNGGAVKRESYKNFNAREKIDKTDTAAVNIHGKSVDITYDKYGNINARTVGRNKAEFLFDVENKLRKSAVFDGRRTTTTEYDYDYTGTRIEKRTDGGDITHSINPFYEITIKSNGRMQETLYVWDHMGRVAAFTQEVSDEDFAGLLPAASQPNITADAEGLFESATAYIAETVSAAPNIWFAGTSESVQRLSPIALLLLLTGILLALFERFSAGKFKAQKLSNPGKRNLIYSITSSAVIAVLLTMISAPTARAALEAGDGTPKPGQVTYFHYDVRGSVIAVSDEAGNQTASVSYHPYGALSESVFTAGNNNFRHKMAGLEYDQETGLINGGARTYDPQIGKYLSVDPARATRDPYAYTSGDPINFVDVDGRMIVPAPLAFVMPTAANIELQVRRDVPADNAADIEIADPEAVRIRSDSDQSDGLANGSVDDEQWVRYPTFWNWTFGIKSDARVPVVSDPAGGQATQADRDDYNELARSGYMQGWTRMGGYLQSLLGAGLLAWWFPSSHTFIDGSVTTPGFVKDLGIYAMTVTAFSAYGKGYTANESLYWQGVKGDRVTSKDYRTLALRRMFWKVSVQLVAFTSITFLARWIRGFPLFEEESDTGEAFTEFAFLLLKNFVFSTVGTAALLPYYLMTKSPSSTYDSVMTQEELNAMPWWRRWTIKASIAYRSFNTRGAFWKAEQEPFSRSAVLQAMWYPLYILQMYGWYLVGSAGYYGGFASVVPAIPQVGWEAFRTAWLRNLTLIILAPAASPLAYLNAWSRKSFTWVKKRSALNPRTSGLGFRILGPIEGLRLAKFDDAAYLSEEEWMARLQTHRDEQSRSDENSSNEDDGSRRRSAPSGSDTESESLSRRGSLHDPEIESKSDE